MQIFYTNNDSAVAKFGSANYLLTGRNSFYIFFASLTNYIIFQNCFCSHCASVKTICEWKTLDKAPSYEKGKATYSSVVHISLHRYVTQSYNNHIVRTFQYISGLAIWMQMSMRSEINMKIPSDCFFWLQGIVSNDAMSDIITTAYCVTHSGATWFLWRIGILTKSPSKNWIKYFERERRRNWKWREGKRERETPTTCPGDHLMKLTKSFKTSAI